MMKHYRMIDCRMMDCSVRMQRTEYDVSREGNPFGNDPSVFYTLVGIVYGTRV